MATAAEGIGWIGTLPPPRNASDGTIDAFSPISDRITGCRYAMIASVSSAAVESEGRRFFPRSRSTYSPNSSRP